MKIGSRTAATAYALPVILPPLVSIVTMLAIPEISEMSKRHILIKKVKPTHSDLGLNTRGKVNAIRDGKFNAKPQRAQVSEKLANLLTRTFTRSVVAGACDNTQPQELQNRALSGFSLLHFGQYICILLIFFISCLRPLWQVRCSVVAGTLKSFGIFRPLPGLLFQPGRSVNRKAPRNYNQYSGRI